MKYLLPLLLLLLLISACSLVSTLQTAMLEETLTPACSPVSTPETAVLEENRETSPSTEEPGALPTPTVSPAGSYSCTETEYSLIWRMDVITLNADGSSVYNYTYGPTSGIDHGTWVYTPTTREVGLTGFRWRTATFRPPDWLDSSFYVAHAGVELALYCQRVDEP